MENLLQEIPYFLIAEFEFHARVIKYPSGRLVLEVIVHKRGKK